MVATLGADSMFFFNKNAKFQLDVFAGAGIAYSRYDSKLALNKDLNTFGAAMNAGVHADITQNYGIDIGAKFLTNKASAKSNAVYEYIGVNTLSYNVKIRHKPAFFVRYMFQF